MIPAMREFPIIVKLGGRDAAFDVLRRRAGRPGTVDALRMWAARGSMPGFAMTVFMAEAAARGIGYDADDFKVAELADPPLEPQQPVEQVA